MRNSASIKNKLLDAFNPSLQLQQTTPFRMRDKQEDSTRHNPPLSSSHSQMSITRQSYINLEEHLQDNPPSHLTSRSVNRSKDKRKYIQVISNPNQIFTHSSKASLMKNSCILDNRATAIMSASNTALSSQRYHQSCSNLQASLGGKGDSRILQRAITPSQVNQRVVNTFNDNKSVQSLEASKINVLQQLVSAQETPKKNHFPINYHHFAPHPSNTLNKNRGESPSRITRAYSLQIQTQPPRQLMHPPQQNCIQQQLSFPHRPPSPSPHRPAAQQNLIMRCIPLNNGQPAFRTIVKKDMHQHKPPLKIGEGTNFAKIEQRYSRQVGKQNVIFETGNIRSQIAQFVLR